ncbi:hypothetical protein H0R92_13820 [Treponema sp. OMZ 840]|uniref:hypothetical protein n=1 Tax=Treponema sp. OMZ 840 TaxID=244313 RepID=UPI003D94B32B
MNIDICDTVINRFLHLDKPNAVPFSIRLHCIRCKKCRSLIQALSTVENRASAPLRTVTPADDPCITRIMEHIDPDFAQKTEDPVQIISFKRWISSGCILIAAILLFGLFSAADIKSEMQILLYLCFALFISGYCAFFVGSNLNFFIKKIQAIRPV